MELTNYMYMIVIALVIFTGAAYVQGDLTYHYPSLVASSGGSWANSTASLRNLTSTANELNTTMQAATDEAKTITNSDVPFAAVFGYLLGMFNAVVTLTRVPAILNDVVAAIMLSMGIFVPAWTGMFVTFIIGIGFLISILYYISKVK